MPSSPQSSRTAFPSCDAVSLSACSLPAHLAQGPPVGAVTYTSAVEVDVGVPAKEGVLQEGGGVGCGVGHQAP